MSEVRVNKLSPRSGTTVTLGDSGDTISIPSGVTLSNAGTNTFASATITGDLTVDTTTLYVDSTNNRVGIGTNSPDQLLHIKSTGNTRAKIEAGTASTFGQLYLGTENQYIIGYGSTHSVADALSLKNLNASGTIRFFNSGDNERMRIDSSGNVGIGTSSPSARIHGIVGADWDSTNYSFLFQNEETQNSYGNTVRIIGGGGAGAGNSASNILTVGDNDDNIDFVVRGDGNVGIGTSSPAEKLEVYGTEASGGVEILLTNVGEGGGTTVPYTAIRSKLNSLRNGGEIRFGRDSGYTGESSSDSNIQFYTAVNNVNTEAMRINSSGNVGIGTSSPGAELDVLGAILSPSEIRITNNGGSVVDEDPIGKYSFYTTDGSGIGARELASIRGISGSGGTTFAGELGFYTSPFNSNVAEAMRIDQNGNVGIGITSPDSKLRVDDTANKTILAGVNSNASFSSNGIFLQLSRNTTNNSFYAMSYYNAGAGSYKFRVADSGNVTNTNNSYGAISDEKLKENIIDATPKLEKLKQVRIVNFNFINDNQKQIGVIAQELENIFPNMVEETPDKDEDGKDLNTTTKQVKYSVFVPILIKALQEQETKIEELEARITTLEANNP
jgi:hypothetical protein